MSDQLGISVGATGLTVTVPGVIAAFASICLPLAVGRLDRRVLLAALLAVMAIGSVVSALAPTFTILIVSRVLVGITIGGFWAIAGWIPVRLVPGPSVPRALTLVFGGVAAEALLVAGHYAAYTFVSPVLLDISGVSSAITGLLLLVWVPAYGAAPVALQTWVLHAAPGNAEAATAGGRFRSPAAEPPGTPSLPGEGCQDRFSNNLFSAMC